MKKKSCKKMKSEKVAQGRIVDPRGLVFSILSTPSAAPAEALSASIEALLVPSDTLIGSKLPRGRFNSSAVVAALVSYGAAAPS